MPLSQDAITQAASEFAAHLYKHLDREVGLDQAIGEAAAVVIAEFTPEKDLGSEKKPAVPLAQQIREQVAREAAARAIPREPPRTNTRPAPSGRRPV